MIIVLCLKYSTHSIFRHSIFRQFPYFAVILPTTPNLSVCPEDAKISLKISDFDRNSRISPEIYRNFPKMPRDLPETRFSEYHLTFYIWPFFPLRTRCSIRKWVNRLFPVRHIYLSIYRPSIHSTEANVARLVVVASGAHGRN